MYKLYCLLVPILCTSCIYGELNRLNIDDKFNYSTIHGKKIFLSEIINKAEQQDFNHCDKLMYECFKGPRKVYEDTYVASATVKEELLKAGEQYIFLYKNALQSYRKYGYVNQAIITELGKVLGDNYICFASIDSHYASEDKFSDHEYNKDTNTHYTIRTVTSSLEGSITIFDLASGNVVFDASHTKIMKNKDKTQDLFGISINFSGPSEIDHMVLAQNFFDDLALNIPGKGENVSKWYGKYKYISPIAKSDYGCISGDCLNGEGVLKYYRGEKYTGTFKNGIRNGSGEFIDRYGKKHTGTFVNDEEEKK